MAAADSGLALFLMLLALAMVVVPPALLGVLGWALTRGKKGGWVGGLLGLVLGIGGVVYIFFWDSITNPTVILDVPTGYDHGYVVLIEDPGSSLELSFEGQLGPQAHLPIPSHGVQRVADLQALSNGATVQLGDGELVTEARLGPAPEGLRGTGLFVFTVDLDREGNDPGLLGLDDDALVKRIAELEATAE